MNSNLGEGVSYSNIMYYMLGGLRESVAIRRVKETSQVLASLGYSPEEIGELLNSVLDRKNC